MVLFSYLLILDVGMLVLSAFKKWPLVHWAAFACTVLLFTAWLGVYVLGTLPDPPHQGAFVFLRSSTSFL